jgi:hypothetical protein
MGKERENLLLKSNLIILSLCLCSIALCVLADPVILWENDHHNSGPGGFPGHSHFDEHEDDFVLAKTASGNTQAVEVLARISTHLPNLSHFPSPITPPPKSQ